MSDFVKGIVKLAKEYRASKKDARFSKQKQLPKYCRQWQMVAFILDRFCNPQETLNKKYTDPQYKYNSKNYHG